MSSDSYNPSEESDSDSDFRPRARTSRSFSQTGIPSSRPSTPHGFDGVDDLDDNYGDGAVAPGLDRSKTRHEWVDAQLKSFDPKSLHAYTEILASVEKDINFDTIAENEEFIVTQNGAVVWTATEKEVFFKHLDRKGKNGIKEIAVAVGTKSELEVMDYLSLLHRGVENQHLLQRSMRTIIMGDIPGAAEISEECCSELDKFAELLAAKEEVETTKAARLQYDDYGIISEAQAKELVKPREQHPLRGNIHLAGDLLNVPNWVQLSRRFFMNFGGKKEQDNWRNLVQSKTESPAIGGDALMDFYALATSLTRRLMQSAIFFAMARLRSSQLLGRERTNNVRRRDVTAAINVLNMKSRPSDFLLQFARKNGLIIADITNQKGWVPRVYNYDEAAEILHGDDDVSDGAGGDESATETEEEPQIDETLPDPDEDPAKLSDRPWEIESAIDREEEFADILDREANRREELGLWTVVGKPAPPLLHVPIISEEDAKVALYKPARERKSKQDLVDWRDRTLYRSEWEEYGSDLEDVERDLAEHRRKRRWIEDDPSGWEDEGPTESKKRPKTKSANRPVFRSASIVNSDDLSSDAAPDAPEPNAGDVDMNERMAVDEPSAPP
ncbi:hypothetical protein N7492_000741 [Penicillium capsulatum]|uniref:Myb-like domain-containing protein n=1 Tax=Penicillium capsulatum TaxID=69766 RepID=A0A9W9IR03_9EURO|nr:hypothetical protein N7492_000741 [Penicillium capsulatum]